MYVGIDVGGTKTLFTILNTHGEIVERVKFPTPVKYDDWLLELQHQMLQFSHHELKAGVIAVPGKINRALASVTALPNLPNWGHDIPVVSDVEKIFECPFVVENDAKLAGLSEAMLLKEQYSKVLYVTVSTGIGYSLIIDQHIDTNVADLGGSDILLEHQGKLLPWESFASGHAIVERFNKKAMDITDPKTWRVITHDIARGLIELIAITEPEIIVIGGSVGTYFERYGELLREALASYEVPMLKMPEVIGAQRPEEAVAYGCYDLARQVFDHAGESDR